MARYQSVRGNPEEKLSVIIDDFSGGVNTTSSDDLTPPNESRFLSNYKLEQQGDLRSREGWKRTAVSELFEDTKAPTLVPTQRSALFGSAHNRFKYRNPVAIDKGWDKLAVQNTGQVLLEKRFGDMELEVVPNKVVGWEDFKPVEKREEMNKEGWDAFRLYGTEANALSNWDFNSESMVMWNEYPRNEDGTVTISEESGWGMRQSLDPPRGEYLVMIRAKSRYGSAEGRVNLAKGGQKTFLDEKFALGAEWEVYSFVTKVDQTFDDIRIHALFVDEEYDIDWLYLSPVENNQPAYTKTPLENGLTRIQTWGGHSPTKLLLSGNTEGDKSLEMTKSFYIENKGSPIRVSGRIRSVDIDTGYEGLVSVTETTHKTDMSIRTLGDDDKLDIIVGHPSIVEGDNPMLVTFIEDEDEDKVSYKTYGGESPQKLKYVLGVYSVGDDFYNSVYIENNGKDMYIEGNGGTAQKVLVPAGFKGEKSFVSKSNGVDPTYFSFTTRETGDALDFSVKLPKILAGNTPNNEVEMVPMEDGKVKIKVGKIYYPEIVKVQFYGEGGQETTINFAYKVTQGKMGVRLTNSRYEEELESNEDTYFDLVRVTATSRKTEFALTALREDSEIILSTLMIAEGTSVPPVVEKVKLDNGKYHYKITGGGDVKLKLEDKLEIDKDTVYKFNMNVDNRGDDFEFVSSFNKNIPIKVVEGINNIRETSKPEGDTFTFELRAPRNSHLEFIADDLLIAKEDYDPSNPKEANKRVFYTKISEVKKGELIYLDWETKTPEKFKVSLVKRTKDGAGHTKNEVIGTFSPRRYDGDRFIGLTKATIDAKEGSTMDENRNSYSVDIVLEVRHLSQDENHFLKINRLSKPFTEYSLDEFTDQVLLIKVLKNEYNVVGRLLEQDSIEDFQKTLVEEAEYSFDFAIVHRVVSLKEGSNKAEKGKIKIEVISFKITRDKVHKKVKTVETLNTDLHPYLKDFGAQTLNIANIDSAISKGSMIFTGTEYGIIEVYEKDDGDYDVRFVGNKRKGITNSAYKPSPLEVRRVGFNVLGDSPLTWIDSTGMTSKSIQGIYVTDENNVPAAVLPMGKPFKIHIMYTGSKADFDITLSVDVGKEDRKELDAEIKQISNEKGLYIGLVNFKTQPLDEVEFEIKFKGDDKIPPMYDYYLIGQIPPDAKPVSAIDVGSYGITQMWDRYVYFKGDTLWYSDFSRFDYVPNLNYITLPLRPNDNIVNITFFRTSYMIFTQERIYKISGMFDTEDTRVDLVSDTVGCVAPSSVAMVDNKLFFLSTIGLVALKAEVFRQNLENIELIDDKISNMIETTTAPHAFSLKNQYILFLNNNYVPEYKDEDRATTSVGGREVPYPNVIRYYTDTESFAFDLYKEYKHPLFVFEIGGNLFSYRWNTLFTYIDSDGDFEESFELELETPASNFGYPSHEKKYKQLILKLGKESYQQRFEVDVIIDGELRHTEIIHPDSTISEVDVVSSRFHIEKIRLPSLKGKNIALRIRTDSSVPSTVMSISYVFKLGKIRERRAYR